MDDLIIYVVVTCYDKSFISSNQRVLHIKGVHTTVVFVLGIGGGGGG